MVVPPKHPKWSFLVGKPMVVGYHHLRKPPYEVEQTIKLCMKLQVFRWTNLIGNDLRTNPLGFSQHISKCTCFSQLVRKHKRFFFEIMLGFATLNPLSLWFWIFPISWNLQMCELDMHIAKTSWNFRQDSFGQEAVDTLIKEMEDKRKNVIVILAGYDPCLIFWAPVWTSDPWDPFVWSYSINAVDPLFP